MAHGYSAGRLTGLYREDYTDNSSSAIFATYRDVFREAQPSLTATGNVNDSYVIRVRQDRKGTN